MSEEKPSEQSSTWKDWSWKILLWLLIPVGALIAKDIYDYAKTTVDPTRTNPPAAAVGNNRKSRWTRSKALDLVCFWKRSVK